VYPPLHQRHPRRVRGLGLAGHFLFALPFLLFEAAHFDCLLFCA
jgi:hypothetical protein